MGVKPFCTLKSGFATNFFILAELATNSTLTCFQMFSIVLPNTLLLINLKKSLSKHFSLGPLLGVQINMGLQPGCLLKLEHLLDLSQLDPQFQVQLQIAIMKYVVCLVMEIGDKFFYSTRTVL